MLYSLAIRKKNKNGNVNYPLIFILITLHRYLLFGMNERTAIEAGVHHEYSKLSSWRDTKENKRPLLDCRDVVYCHVI
ncbi:hypothetical protein SOASR015_00520 [Pectobacterium carotovorum subsp. carotovorum]|nr:hypothetical protein KCO_02782 [Pectobacterium brasiliense ICMP 19477]GKX41018.1 hypothetical protein SOASR015_00520 [Pectobacterium carotovorum subsp. carotovorum]GLX56799.1 hypothetical protein Pcaca02_21080 [Pectobacterium carotovorum subsp. carotovorum]GLY60292.1 hypothetical protein Pcaca05_11500 [Pectobacterium carotovorum subsp. carotovorum]